MNKTLLKSMLVAGMLTMGLGVQAKDDVTETYVKNADLSVDPKEADNGWTLGLDKDGNPWRQDYQKASDDTHVNVVEFYAGWGNLDYTSYSMKQTIANLPKGNYRLAVNAFYRQGNDGNGTNNNYAYIFAGEKKQNVVGLAKGGISSFTGSNDTWKASNGFYKGYFSNEFDFTMTETGDIEIGFEGTFPERRCWFILGPVKLYRYTIEGYLADYDAKVAEAGKIEGKMSAKAAKALKEAIVDKSTLKTAEDVAAAIKTLNEAMTDANNSIAEYKNIKYFIENTIAKIDPGLDLTEMWAAYNEGTLESTSELLPMFQKLEIAHLGTAPNTDFTKAIINPSFEFGNTDGWVYTPSSDHGAKENANATYTVDNAEGDWVFNIWPDGNAISQTINGLPKGKYKMKALIASDPGKQVQLSGNDEALIVDADEKGKEYGVTGEVTFYVTDGSATIGAKGKDGCWYKVDDFRLTLLIKKEAVEQTLELAVLPTLTYGDDAYTLPQKTNEGQTLTWSIDNETVATVSGNTLNVIGTGTATITATQEGNDDYKPFSREFTLKVNKAPLTITADNCTREEGDANPELTVSYEGFVYGDDATSLTTQPVVTTTAIVNSPVGTYPITVSGAASKNYVISYVNGTLNVTAIEETDIMEMDNVIYINSIESTAGSQLTLSVKMKNSAPIRGFQFNLKLPDGVTVAKNSKDRILATLGNERRDEDDQHTLTVGEQDDGSILFLCGSQYNEVFTGNDGEIMTLTVNIAEDMADGNYAVRLKNIKLTESDISKYYETEEVKSIRQSQPASASCVQIYE